MKSFFAFTKKEFLEQIRTYKTFILFTVFLLFGITSPLLAKFMPQIFASMNIEGIKITIPEPTYLDAYTQFFKNMTQMGMIAVLLIFSGIISQELTKGTLINMLSKGLSRNILIISKYTAALLLWTAGFITAAATNYGYTIYLFGAHDASHLIFSCFCLWLFGAFLIALILFSSTLTKGNYGGLLLTAMILGGLLIANIFPSFTKYNPVTLASDNTALIANTVGVNDLLASISITLGAVVFCLIGTMFIFKKKQI